MELGGECINRQEDKTRKEERKKKMRQNTKEGVRNRNLGTQNLLRK